ncbi:hypothetical protein I7I53_03567 [Histoplasma capsulatum var. duboisii H88]|uniref:Uncharacterized protein n=1 Tax=Ajellomyces capsulatus (strain H88) TaxID=544711 RepID=A0A8A1LPA6_AJEC8|nr:hypothetical protein I7I53_03567 [Histoplasma capsulatum var. duboisii H88]
MPQICSITKLPLPPFSSSTPIRTQRATRFSIQSNHHEVHFVVCCYLTCFSIGEGNERTVRKLTMCLQPPSIPYPTHPHNLQTFPLVLLAIIRFLFLPFRTACMALGHRRLEAVNSFIEATSTTAPNRS